VACVLSACVPPRAPARPKVLSGLAGLSLPLRGAGVRLATQGWVEELPAEVLLDLATPLSTVTTGCFTAPPPAPRARVRVPRPEGGHVELGQVPLPRVRLGDRELEGRPAGLVQRRGCSVTLGSDVLGPYAISVEPLRRELSFSPSRPREHYLRELAGVPASTEAHLLELARDPGGDWPLVSLRLRQGDTAVAGPFVLSTREARSSIDEGLAQRRALVSERATLQAAGLPTERPGPAAYALDALELLPGLALERARLEGHPGWRNPGALGALGGDVWGRFLAVFDTGAGVLWLKRPRVATARGVQRCPAGEGREPSEDACFELRSAPSPRGVELSTVVWRDLPEGGRLYLQPLDAEGQPLPTRCQLGLTFEPADRGATAAHLVPWAGLEKTSPVCARALSQARGAALALFEEGWLPECPGDCAFVGPASSRRMRCECPLPSPSALTDAERRLLRKLRTAPSRPLPSPSPAAPVPSPDEPAEPAP